MGRHKYFKKGGGEQAGSRGGCPKKGGGWNPLTNYDHRSWVVHILKIYIIYPAVFTGKIIANKISITIFLRFQKDHLQISLLALSEFKQTNSTLLPMKS